MKRSAFEALVCSYKGLTKHGILISSILFVAVFFVNPASALTVNFNVTGNYVRYPGASFEENIAFIGTAILDVDEAPLELAALPSCDGYADNFNELFNSFVMDLSGDNGEAYSGAVYFDQLMVTGLSPLTAAPANTFINIDNLDLFLGDSGPCFINGELISRAFLPTWSIYSAGFVVDALPDSFLSLTFTERPAPVPEPAAFLLIGSCLLGLAVFRKKLRG